METRLSQLSDLNVNDDTLALFGVKNRFTGFIYSELGLTPHPLVSKMEGISGDFV